MSSADRTLPGSGEDTKAVAPSFGFGQRRDASQPMTFSFRRSVLRPPSSQTLPTQTPSDESAEMPVRHHPAAVAGPTGFFLKRPTAALPAVAPQDTKAAVVSPNEEPAAALVPPTRPRAPHSLASSHFVPELAPYEPTRWTPFGAVMAAASTRALVSFFATLHETQVSLPPLAPMVLHMVNDDAVQRRITLEPTHDPAEVLSSPNWWRDVGMINPDTLAVPALAPRLRRVVVAESRTEKAEDSSFLSELLRSFASMSTLRHFGVSGYAKWRDVTLSDFTSLRTLDVSETGFTDLGVAQVATLPHLSCLYLRLCLKVTDVRSLAHAASLMELDVRRTPLHADGIAGLERHPTLTSLTVSASDVVVGTLGSSSSLTHLHLEGAADSLEGLQRCPTLRHFTYLQSEEVTDALSVIKAMPALETVYLGDSGANRVDMAEELNKVTTLRKLVTLHQWPKVPYDIVDTLSHVSPALTTLVILDAKCASPSREPNSLSAALEQAMTTVTSLSLWAEEYTRDDFTLLVVSHLHGLTTLELRFERESADDVLEGLAACSALTRLTLTDMSIGARGSLSLPLLGALRSLTIWEPTSLHMDTMGHAIAKMPSLQRFAFSSSRDKYRFCDLFTSTTLRTVHLHHQSFVSVKSFGSLPPQLHTLALIQCEFWRYALNAVMDASTSLRRLVTRGVPTDIVDRLRTAMPRTDVVAYEQQKWCVGDEAMEGHEGDFRGTTLREIAFHHAKRP